MKSDSREDKLQEEGHERLPNDDEAIVPPSRFASAEQQTDSLVFTVDADKVDTTLTRGQGIQECQTGTTKDLTPRKENTTRRGKKYRAGGEKSSQPREQTSQEAHSTTTGTKSRQASDSSCLAVSVVGDTNDNNNKMNFAQVAAGKRDQVISQQEPSSHPNATAHNSQPAERTYSNVTALANNRTTNAINNNSNASFSQQNTKGQNKSGKHLGAAYLRSQTMPPRLEQEGTVGKRSRLSVENMFSGVYRKPASRNNKMEVESNTVEASAVVATRSTEEKRLNRIVSETGEDAWGVDAVEVWVLEHGTLLIRPEGGYWRNPDLVMDEFLSRLEDPSNLNHVPADPISVGVDLAGHLWTESKVEGGGIFGGRAISSSPSGSSRGGSHFGSLRSGNLFGRVVRSPSMGDSQGSRHGKVFTDGSIKGEDVFASLFQSMGGSRVPDQHQDNVETGSATNNNEPIETSNKPRHRRVRTWTKFGRGGGSPKNNETEEHPRLVLQWRDIHSLVEDPDLPKTPRLVLLHNAGFNYAAGVPFHAGGGGRQGLVIFLTMLQQDAEQLGDYHNQVFMIRAAESIGSVVAANEARMAAMAVRPALEDNDGQDDDPGKGNAPENVSGMNKSTCDTATKRTKMWLRKCMAGGNLQIPPAMTIRQSSWTLVGSLSALLLLSGLNNVIQKETNEELFFIMGPIGALMALQYGLTAAPASQPRNALLGQALAGAISLSFTYIPQDLMGTWVRQAIAPSVAIAIMGKLGVMHPPAGASSVILASGVFGWKHYGMLLVATAISLLPAVMINNLSLKRQYPTHSWREIIGFN